MLKEVYKDLQGLSVLEMRMYLRAEIAKYLVGEYKDMTTETKLHLYKLNSFLVFCNELDKKEEILKAMLKMCEAKVFKDRNDIINEIKKVA